MRTKLELHTHSLEPLLKRNTLSKHTQKLSVNLGGGKRDRTADLLHAMQALSQLSYTPQKLSKIHCV